MKIFHFTNEFLIELKVRAEMLTGHIENLRDVFSLVETSSAWKPYMPLVYEKNAKQFALFLICEMHI